MDETISDDDLLKGEAVAKMLDFPESRLAKARVTGDPEAAPPFIKLGHLVRYRRGDVRQWVATRPRYQSTSELAA